jgi:hypothetical protein
MLSSILSDPQISLPTQLTPTVVYHGCSLLARIQLFLIISPKPRVSSELAFRFIDGQVRIDN